jgi:hypothetical protein
MGLGGQWQYYSDGDDRNFNSADAFRALQLLLLAQLYHSHDVSSNIRSTCFKLSFF